MDASQQQVEIPPALMVQVLYQRAANDPLLRAHLDAAMWQAAWIVKSNPNGVEDAADSEDTPVG